MQAGRPWAARLDMSHYARVRVTCSRMEPAHGAMAKAQDRSGFSSRLADGLELAAPIVSR
jgi:hypothetical protein